MEPTLSGCIYFSVYITMTLLIAPVYVHSKVFTLRADFERNRDNHEVMTLSNATGGRALLLKQGEPLSLNFCLRQRTVVQIADFRFSNGNKSEKVLVTIDNVPMGMFTTLENFRSDWNDFLSTGQFPRWSYLDIGWHTVMVKFNGTSDGIVVDKLDIGVKDNYMTSDIFTCELTCIPDVTFHFRPNQNIPDNSFVVQESFTTKCPEVDNVNIPIFNPSVKSYEVTATLPQYRTFANWRHENTTGCKHLSPVLWTFKHILLHDAPISPIHTEQTILYFSKGWDTRYSKLSVLVIPQFQLEGKTKGMVDSEIGSHLKLKFRGLPTSVKVTMRYKGRARGISHGEERLLTPQTVNTEWNIPDFTWSENNVNLIFLYIDANTTEPLEIEELYLERRPMLPDKVVTVYKSDNVIVEAIFVEFWWLAPDNMTLTLSNEHSYHNVSYFRIYRPIPWSTGYAQVFVLYQDGNSRLLPVPPQGVDWIPFGSSVIIGQSNPVVVRPYASIAVVHLDLDSLRMRVRYTDGGTANLQLLSSLTETRVVITDMTFKRSPALFPFTTFRSMYVSEGNSDVDHVSINGLYSRHIMENFGVIMGRRFVFFRKCMSKHLNLSPDTYIDIREASTISEEQMLIDRGAFQQLLQRIQSNRGRLWTPKLRNYG